MAHKTLMRKQSSRFSTSSSGSSSSCGFQGKLRCFTLCLFCLAVFNFTMLHLVQSALIDFYGGDDSFLSFSQDLIANWDPTSYSVDKSILPEKIITVIGKESSGTTFVAKTIAHALKLPGRQKYRDGYFHQERRAYDEMPIQVQHVSLPQGQWCLQNHSHHLVDVILPPHCVPGKNGRYPSATLPGIRAQCEALINGTGKNAMQMYEGMMEMHGPWFIKKRWQNQFYYKAVRYPGRIIAQSEAVKSRNVTIVRRKRGKMTREEIMERREERHRHYRGQLLGTAFENPDSEPPDRDSDEDPPPIVIQRPAVHRHPRIKRRLAGAEGEKARMPIKFRFSGGEVKQVPKGEDEAEHGMNHEAEHGMNHPPRHRAFRHDMSNLTEEQKEELERRLRIVNGHDVPSGDWGEPGNENEQLHRAETPNEILRRQNQERKRAMMRREREAFRRQMDAGGDNDNSMNDDEPMLHGRRPSRLSRQQKIDDWLRRVERYPLEQLQNDSLLMYPGRFLLNITSQKIWYDAHGTEQVIVIVVRDPKMSLQSRLKSHCHIVELAKEEEEIANAILNDAIQTFFLDDKSGFQSGFGGRWYGKTVEEIKQEAFVWDPTPIIENRTTTSGDPKYSSLIPANGNVVLVSYEAMMKYGQDYAKELYKVMGIESDYKPEFKDGNLKYRNDTEGRAIRRRERASGELEEDSSPWHATTEDDVGFRFRWLLRQPERYQGIMLAAACISVFVGSFAFWVLIFWLMLRRVAADTTRKSSRATPKEVAHKM